MYHKSACLKPLDVKYLNRVESDLGVFGFLHERRLNLGRGPRCISCMLEKAAMCAHKLIRGAWMITQGNRVAPITPSPLAPYLQIGVG